MGKNGQEKSTYSIVYPGLLTPDTGSINSEWNPSFDSEHAITCRSKIRNRLRFTDPGRFFPSLTVRENIAYGLKARHKPRDLAVSHVKHWLWL